MDRHFIQELDVLHDNIIKMASLVDEQVATACNALEKGDPLLCKHVKAKDKEVDSYDNLIRTEVENLLALYQPVAADLRLVLTAGMVNLQLERCGDIAVNIAQRVKRTADQLELIIGSRLIEMGKTARSMLGDAIDSFIHRDSQLARSVLQRDNIVDDLNKQAFAFLVEKMKEDAGIITAGAHLLILSRHIERLADHATNIAEDVIFLVDGEIVSHYGRMDIPGNGE